MLFVYFVDQSSVWYRAGEDLFPLCRLPLCLVDHFLCLTEASQFQEIPFIVSLSVCATGVIFRKRSPVSMCSSAFDILISIFFYCGWSQLFELSNIFIVIFCLSVGLFVVFQLRVSLCILVCPWNSLCRQGWPQTHRDPAVSALVQGLKACSKHLF